MKTSINKILKQDKLTHKTPKKQRFDDFQGDIVHKLSSFHQSPLRYKRISQLKISLGQAYTSSLKNSFNCQTEQTQQLQSQITQSERNPRSLNHYLFKKKPSLPPNQVSPKPAIPISTEQLSHLKSLVERINRTQRCKTIASQLVIQNKNPGREKIESPDQSQTRGYSLILPKVTKINPYSHSKLKKRSRVVFNFSHIQTKPAVDISERLTTDLKPEPPPIEVQDIGMMQGWTSSYQLNDIQIPSLNCGLQAPELKSPKHKKLRMRMR